MRNRSELVVQAKPAATSSWSLKRSLPRELVGGGPVGVEAGWLLVVPLGTDRQDATRVDDLGDADVDVPEVEGEGRGQRRLNVEGQDLYGVLGLAADLVHAYASFRIGRAESCRCCQFVLRPASNPFSRSSSRMASVGVSGAAR